MNYAERFKFVNNTSYGNQVSVALWIAASAILADTKSTSEAVTWARQTLKGAADTATQRQIMVRVASSTEISEVEKGIADDLIQKIVDSMVPELVGT